MHRRFFGTWRGRAAARPFGHVTYDPQSIGPNRQWMRSSDTEALLGMRTVSTSRAMSPAGSPRIREHRYRQHVEKRVSGLGKIARAGPKIVPWRGFEASRSTSILLRRTPRLPVQAKSLRPQALYLVVERVHFLISSYVSGFRRIGAAQFFERFLDREFWCFSHGKPQIRAMSVTSSIDRETYFLQIQRRVDLDQHGSLSADSPSAQRSLPGRPAAVNSLM